MKKKTNCKRKVTVFLNLSQESPGVLGGKEEKERGTRAYFLQMGEKRKEPEMPGLGKRKDGNLRRRRRFRLLRTKIEKEENPLVSRSILQRGKKRRELRLFSDRERTAMLNAATSKEKALLSGPRKGREKEDAEGGRREKKRG